MIVAILSLALGIGANTAIFQLLDAVRLRTLPVKAPQQLATVGIVHSPHCCRGDFYSRNADLTGALWNQHARRSNKDSPKSPAWAPFRFNLGQGGEARYADTLMVSGDFFNVLGVQPLLGRLISPADDYQGCGAQGAVLSYRFLAARIRGTSRSHRQQAHARRPSLSDHWRVAPPSFYGIEVGRKFDVAIAICSQPVFSTKGWPDGQPRLVVDRDDRSPQARLDPRARLRSTGCHLSRNLCGHAARLNTTPSRKKTTCPSIWAHCRRPQVFLAAADYEDPLWLLLALSGLVLLIACANLANLMLARASVRQREMALRLTLGASRSRLIRQLLAESLLLAALGTIAGAALAQVLSRVLVAFLSTQQSRIFVELTPDWRVLGFAAGLAILTCVLFGLVPAIQASRTEPGVAMKAGGRGATAGRDAFCCAALWWSRRSRSRSYC